jgi:hypothetical protein
MERKPRRLRRVEDSPPETRRSDEVDALSEESFPASDPPPWPGTIGGPPVADDQA